MRTLLLATIVLFIEANSSKCCMPVHDIQLFKCNGVFIIEDTAGSTLRSCEDRLTFYMGTNIPPKHQQSPVDSPVRIVARYYDANNQEQQNEIHTTFWFDYNKGLLVVQPDSFPVSQEGDPNPIQYRVYNDCRYFDGPNGAEPTMRYLYKQNIFRARAEARVLEDSSNITDSVYISPTGAGIGHYLIDGIDLDADELTRNWAFNHWSSSIPIQALDEHKLSQNVKQDCWPLKDTVVFTAWFSTNISEVGNQSTVGIECIVSTVDGNVVINNAFNITKWSIVDVRGRVVCNGISRNNHQLLVNTQLLRGPLYVLVEEGLKAKAFPLFFH